METLSATFVRRPNRPIAPMIAYVSKDVLVSGTGHGIERAVIDKLNSRLVKIHLEPAERRDMVLFACDMARNPSRTDELILFNNALDSIAYFSDSRFEMALNLASFSRMIRSAMALEEPFIIFPAIGMITGNPANSKVLYWSFLSLQKTMDSRNFEPSNCMFINMIACSTQGDSLNSSLHSLSRIYTSPKFRPGLIRLVSAIVHNTSGNLAAAHLKRLSDDAFHSSFDDESLMAAFRRTECMDWEKDSIAI